MINTSYKENTCFKTRHIVITGRDCVVHTATRYGLDGPRIESQWGAKFSAPVHFGPGAHPASCKKGTGSFPGVKAAGA
jgi:hypothetical protein